MNRPNSLPLFLPTASLLAGILLSLQFPGFFAFPLAGFLLFLLVFQIKIWFFSSAKKAGLQLFLLPVFFFFGILLINSREQTGRDEHFLKQSEPAQSFVAEAISESEEGPKVFRSRLRLLSRQTENGEEKTAGQIWAYFSKESPEKIPAYGDRLLFIGRPEALPAPKNPGEFDFRAYSALQNTHGRIFLRPAAFRILSGENGNFVLSNLLKTRTLLKNHLKKYLPEQREYSVAAALLLGAKTDLDQESLNAYSAAGAMHVLAVSGLHVGIVLLLIHFLFGDGKNLSGFKKYRYLLLSISAVWAYAGLTGLSPSCLRAALMFSLLQVGLARKSSPPPLNTLAASAFLLLCYDPFLAGQLSFQFSYAAVAGILVFQPFFVQFWIAPNKFLHYLWGISCMSAAAQIATLPLVLLYFGQFPVYGILANLVVIPGAFLIMLLGGLFLSLGLTHSFFAEIFGFLLKNTLFCFNEFVFFIQKIPGALIENVHFNSADLWLSASIILCFALFIRLKKIFFLYFVPALALLLSFSRISEAATAGREESLCIPAMKKGTALVFRQGKLTSLLADSALLNDRETLAFSLEPVMKFSPKSRRKIMRFTDDNLSKKMAVKRFPAYDFIVYKTLKIIILRQYSREILPECDVLLAAGRQTLSSSFLEKVRCRELVLGNDFSARKADLSAENARKLGIKVWRLDTEGAYFLSVPENKPAESAF